MSQAMTDNAAPAKRAIHLILLFGLVSLFGDIVYEGARSVNGPYLKVLGANAAIVGLIAGIGEFLGYALRLLSGYLSDRTKAYWVLTFAGYAALISVPLLSLTGIWQFAALFIVLERIGKAARSPARDTILSQATKRVGTGFGFGLHEAMDQIGAVVGPLIFTTLFVVTGGGEKGIGAYQKGYALLWIPFILTIGCVFIAYLRVRDPGMLEEAPAAPKEDRLSRTFWRYTLFMFITTIGFANFILIAYHFKARGIFSDAEIPFLYAVAMGLDAAAALAIGKLYDIFNKNARTDTAGLKTLAVIPLLSLILAPIAFSGNRTAALISIALWGVVMGSHETIMRSAIADLTSIKKRGMGYGIFNTAYGLAMLIGGSTAGALYDRSPSAAVAFLVTVQLLAIPAFFAMYREALTRR